MVIIEEKTKFVQCDWCKKEINYDQLKSGELQGDEWISFVFFKKSNAFDEESMQEFIEKQDLGAFLKHFCSRQCFDNFLDMQKVK